MKERISPNISIYRDVNGEAFSVFSAPITPSAVRRYTLMAENSIVLSFNLDVAYPILVGDYINDEVFGVFYAKDNYSPSYNAQIGCYVYEVTFVSHEMMWSNHKFMLSVTKNNGTYGRKETSWKLTSSLKGHLMQIRQNLVSLGLYPDVVICMSTDIESKDESKFIAYDNDDILSGLKKICDEYECEWWTAYTRQGIHIEYMELNEVFEEISHKGTYFRSPSNDRLGSVGSGVFVVAHKFKAYRSKNNDFTYISETDGGQYYPVLDGERTIFKRRTSIPGVHSADYTYNGNYDDQSIIGATFYELEGTDGSFLYTRTKVLSSESLLYTRRSMGLSVYRYTAYNVLEKILVSRIDSKTNVDDATLCLFVGKCENWDGAELITLEDNVSMWTPTGSDALLFEEGHNVESMTLAKDQTDFANRLYVFGGTQNIPSAYRKKLNFKVDSTRTSQSGMALFEDTIHPIMSKMVSVVNTLPSNKAVLTYVQQIGGNPFPNADIVARFSLNRAFNITLDYNVSAHIKVAVYNGGTEITPSGMSFGAKIILYIVKPLDTSFEPIVLAADEYFNWFDSYKIDKLINFVGSTQRTLTSGSYEVHLKLEEPPYGYLVNQNNYFVVNGTEYRGYNAFDRRNAYYMQVDVFGCDNDNNYVTASYDTYNSYLLNIVYNGQKYLVMFNPDEQGETTPESKMFSFVRLNGNTPVPETTPSGFGIGSYFEPLITGVNTSEDYPYGLSIMEIPLSYYSGEYDNPFSLLTIGESRLCLPLDEYPNGYIGEDLPIHSVVEKVVCFDNVYPRCVLVVTNVTSASKKFKTEYEDWSVIKTAYSEYHVEVKNINGSEFPFKSTYQSQGTLKMDFVNMSALTDEEKRSMPEEAHVSSLAGMQFECNFCTLAGGSKEGFLLIINDNYGTNLPNESLCPKIGDICVLSNWDVRAMLSLGLIENAENTLMAKGVEYQQALTENNYTATCNMVSSRRVLGMQDPFGARYSYVDISGSAYYMPVVGRNVQLVSDTFNGGSKTSRIIGYEFKMDIPYDSPIFTIGETEAYSRLKKIEKELSSR